MHPMMPWRRSAARYFHWLVFTGTVFLGSEMLRMVETYRFYRRPWLDVFASYSLLGTVGSIVALLAAALLAIAERLGQKARSPALRAGPDGVVFALGFAVWLNVLRLAVAANGLARRGVPAVWFLVGFALLGAIVFRLRAGPLRRWLAAMLDGVRPINLLAVPLYLGLTLYLLLEPLDQGRPAPVRIDTPGQKLPNVVIIVLDSLSARDMSLYGYRLPTTPNLERLAQGWTVYENAHAAGAGTLACLPTLLTGRYPYLDDWYRYGDLARSAEGWMNLCQVLHARGYETAYVTDAAYLPMLFHMHAGFDRIVGGFRLPFTERTLRSRMMLRGMAAEYLWGSTSPPGGTRHYPLHDPALVSAEAYLRTRAQAKGGRPFFGYVHLSRPHDPYVAPTYMGTFLPLEEGLTDAASQARVLGAALPRAYAADRQEEIDRLRLRYDENVLQADAEVTELVGVLQESGLYDESLVVITADHGDNFQSGYVTHYTPLLAATEHNIPLLVKYPGQVVGEREEALVSNVDIMPTVLDVIGASYPAGRCATQTRTGIE